MALSLLLPGQTPWSSSPADTMEFKPCRQHGAKVEIIADDGE